MFAIRNKKNQNTGNSPTELVLVKEAKAPGDWFLQGGKGVRRKFADRGNPQLNKHTEKAGSTRHKVGYWVYYRNHPQSEGDQGFHAGFATK